MIIKGTKIQRLEGSARRPFPKPLLPENAEAIAPANAKMITPVRAAWEKNVVQSPHPQITSAKSGSVPPIPNARFLMVRQRNSMEHGAWSGAQKGDMRIAKRG